jgi:hypothetical protein
MKRKLLFVILVFFMGILGVKAQTCQHSVELYDSWGDGWNGGTLTISVNGTDVLTNITLSTGHGPEVHYFDAATGDDIDANYTAGLYASENEYTVRDGGGSILEQSGQSGSIPIDILNMVGNCPACPPPTGQTETNITTTTADLGWTTGGATTWDIEWGPAGFTQGTGTMITGTSDNPYNLSGLTGAQIYDWYVGDNCGGGVNSWVGPSTFTTLPATITIPYTQDFESNTFGNFIQSENNDQSDIFIDAAAAYSSNYGVKMEGKTSTGWTGGSTNTTESQAWNNNATHISTMNMVVDATGETVVFLDFDLKQTYSYGSKYSWFRVVVNGVQVGSSYNPSTQNGDAFQTILIDLSAYAGTIFNLALQHSGKYNDANGYDTPGGDNAYLDNISITAPSCPAPTAQTVANITITTAELGWTESGTADTWHIEWKAGADFTPGTGADDGNATVTPTPSYSLSSLTDVTTYYWYVQADCVTDGSDWTGPHTFTTPYVTPANDLCANAEVVTCGTSVDGTTNGATFDDVGTCGTSNTAPGVWYKLEVDGLFKDFTVSTNHPATNFDTKLSVFSGDCDNLVCVGGNDDIGGSPYNTKSEITVATDPFQPQTYYILVHGYSSNQGDFTLSVTCTEPYPVPLNNWAIYLGIFLITLTMVFVFYRRQA